jgi:hypothetical protein
MSIGKKFLPFHNEEEVKKEDLHPLITFAETFSLFNHSDFIHTQKVSRKINFLNDLIAKSYQNRIVMNSKIFIQV